MKTSQVVAAVVTATVITFGGFAGVIHLDNSMRQERKVSDRCWSKGGTYKDGTCEMPKDLRTPEAKVCEAMVPSGTYVITKDKTTGVLTTTCYDGVGSVKELPDLEGKEVVDMFDGTVVLRDKR